MLASMNENLYMVHTYFLHTKTCVPSTSICLFSSSFLRGGGGGDLLQSYC